MSPDIFQIWYKSVCMNTFHKICFMENITFVNVQLIFQILISKVILWKANFVIQVFSINWYAVAVSTNQVREGFIFTSVSKNSNRY